LGFGEVGEWRYFQIFNKKETVETDRMTSLPPGRRMAAPCPTYPQLTFQKMKKSILFSLAICAAFLSGLAIKTLTTSSNNTPNIKRVTGIGGIFFKCKDPKKMRTWYSQHLGLNTNSYGAVFEWYQGADSTQKGFSQWSTFSEKTKYFEPSTKDFMINYRVENLDYLVENLKKEGVNVVDTIETYDYGKFVHILDPEGNKIELWEPNDIIYEKMGMKMGAKTTK
jgi:predicted enzyme related to lactoylglutathione lyase